MLSGFVTTVFRSIFNREIRLSSSQKAELLRELRNALIDSYNFPFQNTHLTEPQWSNDSIALTNLILNENPRDFLRWKIISSTMFMPFAHYIYQELNYLKNQPDWNKRWRKAIVESSIGNPPPYLFYPITSANLIHHAYHLAQFEEKTGVCLKSIDFIFEFGGGYGSMCRLFYNLGFRGKYVIYDLPPFSALQTYFLRSIGVPVISLTEFFSANSGVVCLTKTNQLKLAISRSKQLKNLFIATWSMSEVPLVLREVILSLVASFQAYLFAYQEKFGDVDNLLFFENWKNHNQNVVWDDVKIKHMPGDNFYLFGKR
jgi:hypothetical protein